MLWWVFGGIWGDIWGGLWGCLARIFEEFGRDLGGEHVLEKGKEKTLYIYIINVLLCNLFNRSFWLFEDHAKTVHIGLKSGTRPLSEGPTAAQDRPHGPQDGAHRPRQRPKTAH